MKKSTVFLMAAVLVLLVSLTAFNLALRAEYLSGAFRDPLRDYAALPFTGFDEVVVEPATLARVRIEGGPYRVRRNPEAAPYLQVRQQGRRLLVSAVFPEGRHWLGMGEALVISCPRLRALTAGGSSTVAGQARRDKEPQGGRVQVLNFAAPADSLRLYQLGGARVELQANRLGYLLAEAGQQPGARPELQLDASNQLRAARLVLGHQTQLQLHNLRIGTLRYELADSVRLDLTGAALPGLLAATR